MILKHSSNYTNAKTQSTGKAPRPEPPWQCDLEQLEEAKGIKKQTERKKGGEGKQQKEELSLLRAEKQQLRKKVHVATQERGQMQHAATALGIDNVALHKAAEQLISKIDKVHRDRLAFMSESEKWRGRMLIRALNGNSQQRAAHFQTPKALLTSS